MDKFNKLKFNWVDYLTLAIFGIALAGSVLILSHFDGVDLEDIPFFCLLPFITTFLLFIVWSIWHFWLDPKYVSDACKGVTPEQKAIIRYFYSPGCMLPTISDDTFDQATCEILSSKKSGIMVEKQTALLKLGLKENEANARDAIKFEGYDYTDSECAKLGEDGACRAPILESGWMFFSSDKLYIYRKLFSWLDLKIKEKKYECPLNELRGIAVGETGIPLKLMNLKDENDGKEIRLWRDSPYPVDARVTMELLKVSLPEETLYLTVDLNDPEVAKALQGIENLSTESSSDAPTEGNEDIIEVESFTPNTIFEMEELTPRKESAIGKGIGFGLGGCLGMIVIFIILIILFILFVQWF